MRRHAAASDVPARTIRRLSGHRRCGGLPGLCAVDILVPPDPTPNTSTSGCEAGDFAGFAAGTIALLQRGSCLFEEKVVNAEAAGAIGMLIFNEGQPGRTDAVFGSLLILTSATIPVIGLSFSFGQSLYALQLNGPVIMRMTVTDATPEPIPEPAAVSLLVLGLGALAAARHAVTRRGARRTGDR